MDQCSVFRDMNARMYACDVWMTTYTCRGAGEHSKSYSMTKRKGASDAGRVERKVIDDRLVPSRAPRPHWTC